MSSPPRLFALLIAALLLATPARAQRLEVVGATDDSAATVLREVAARGRFLLLERDTVLGADFRHPGDLVISRATVRLEGSVAGSVAVLDGELFLRPGARIGGAVGVAGGALYPSAMATTGPVSRVPPEVRVAVVHEPGVIRVTLTLPPAPPRLAPTGIFGFGFPAYDRVNGLTLRAGGQALLGDDPEGAAVTAGPEYYTERGELGGSVALRAPLRPTLWAEVGVARRAETQEEWIRGELSNSLAALAIGSDARNYFDTDVAWARLERLPPEPLLQGQGWVGPFVEARVSRDRSLSAGDPWTVLGDDVWRPNPAIDDGTLASLILGTTLAWRGPVARADAEVGAELAPGGIGDRSFAQLVAEGATEMLALRGHRLALRAHLRLPVGDDPAPRQRWSFVGGAGTLPTEALAARIGDHVVFVESIYGIPLPRVQLPVVGSPEVRLVHAIGSAWVTGEEAPAWEQNLGVGVGVRLLEATLSINPAERRPTPHLSLGLALPF